MDEKKSVTRETAVRYRTAKKGEKHKILDEFAHVTGYNRKYAIHLLANWGKEQILTIKDEAVRVVIGTPRKRKKRRGMALYDQRITGVLRAIWELFDYICGKRLAVLIRLNIDRFQAQEYLGIDHPLHEQLLRISPSTIDRHLKKDCSEPIRQDRFSENYQWNPFPHFSCGPQVGGPI